jgi:hypothetical protein
MSRYGTYATSTPPRSRSSRGGPDTNRNEPRALAVGDPTAQHDPERHRRRRPRAPTGEVEPACPDLRRILDPRDLEVVAVEHHAHVPRPLPGVHPPRPATPTPARRPRNRGTPAPAAPCTSAATAPGTSGTSIPFRFERAAGAHSDDTGSQETAAPPSSAPTPHSSSAMYTSAVAYGLPAGIGASRNPSARYSRSAAVS